MSTAENSASADDSDCLSMVDVLAEQARLQEDASAVLGDSDENNCTYSQGYVQRQALYACATCAPSEPAGICLACSYICHEGHDLYELYTKRFFRCDCGNSKFQAKCKLTQDKDPINTENQYNQNFKGSYCICARPYPDPEDEIEDEMIQCVVCEDWYHGRHLNTAVPENEDYEEMTCGGCMDQHSFLSAYCVESAAVTVKKEEALEQQQEIQVGGEGEVKKEPGADITNPPLTKSPVRLNEECKEAAAWADSATQQHTGASDANGAGLSCPDCSDRQGEMRVRDGEQCTETPVRGTKGRPPPDDEGQPLAKRIKSESNGVDAVQEDGEEEPCLLQDLRKREMSARHGGTFWPAAWRNKLCRCSGCMKMYEEEKIQFLLDENDTVYAYEERGRSRTPTVTDSELEQNALSQMNRIQQVEVLQGFMDLKTELREFLKGFADSGKVVGEEDIRAFFNRMEARKHERLSRMQYHCK